MMKKYFAVSSVILSCVCNVALCDISNVPSVNNVATTTSDVSMNAKQQILNVNVGCDAPVEFKVFQYIGGKQVDVTEFFSVVSSIPDNGQIILIFNAGGTVGFSVDLNGEFIVQTNSYGSKDDSRSVVTKLIRR